MSLVMICTFMDLAYTARALVGLLTTAGLPSTTLLNTKHLKHIREATINLSLAVVQPSHLAQCLTEMILDPSNQIIDEAYRFYRNVQNDTHASIPASARRRGTQDVSVALLGLWDTVGPLGIRQMRSSG